MPELPINFRRVAAFTGVFILILIVIEFNARLEDLNRLNDQRDEARSALDQAKQTEIALETQVAFAQSDAAVEEWARTEGHYVQEGDQPVVPLGKPGSEPVVIATPMPLPTPMQNWEVWLQLFFDQ